MSYQLSSHTILALLIVLVGVVPARCFDLHAWLFDFQYADNTLAGELQCYGLPYGGIGFASHVLTYYTVLMVSLQRSPWMPWRVNTHWFLDFTLAIIGLLASVTLSVLTIIRCRNRWQFIAIAVWKLIMSLTLGLTSLSASRAVKKAIKKYRRETKSGGNNYELRNGAYAKIQDNEATGYFGSAGGLGYDNHDYQQRSVPKKANRTPIEVIEAESKSIGKWVLLYIPGAIAGVAALFSLVVQTINDVPHVRTITIVFGAVSAAPVGLAAIGYCIELMFERGGGGEDLGDTILGIIVFPALMLIVLIAFYSDWILGAIANNLSGAPSSDNALLYWCYFAAKRLPFFSL